MKNIPFLNHLKFIVKDKCNEPQLDKTEIQTDSSSLRERQRTGEAMGEQAKQIKTENIESNLLKLNFKLIDIDTVFGN